MQHEYSEIEKILNGMVDDSAPGTITQDAERPHNNPTKCGIGQWVLNRMTGKVGQVQSIHIQPVQWMTEYYLGDGSKINEASIEPMTKDAFSAYMAMKTMKENLDALQEKWGFTL